MSLSDSHEVLWQADHGPDQKLHWCHCEASLVPLQDKPLHWGFHLISHRPQPTGKELLRLLGLPGFLLCLQYHHQTQPGAKAERLWAECITGELGSGVWQTAHRLSGSTTLSTPSSPFIAVSPQGCVLSMLLFYTTELWLLFKIPKLSYSYICGWQSGSWMQHKQWWVRVQRRGNTAGGLVGRKHPWHQCEEDQGEAGRLLEEQMPHWPIANRSGFQISLKKREKKAWIGLSFSLPGWGFRSGDATNIFQLWGCEAIWDYFVIKGYTNKLNLKGSHIIYRNALCSTIVTQNSSSTEKKTVIH